MKRVYLCLFGIAVSVMSASALADTTKIVTAKQVNGTWQAGNGNTFKVWALGRQQLQVAFDGTYAYRMDNGEWMANLGYVETEARIEGDTALLMPYSERDCQILMRFVAQQLRVTTLGDYSQCGFGHNVMADGVYRKISNKKPIFDAPP